MDEFKTDDIISTAQRGAAKGKVTKSVALLRAAVAKRNPKEIEELITSCTEILEECLQVCEAFNANDNPENAEANEEYSSDIIDKYTAAMEKANEYLESVKKKDDSAHATHTPMSFSPMAAFPTHSEDMERMCDLLSMPETPMELFSGNIMEFHDWYTIFCERIDSKNVSYVVKLNKLFASLQGEPLELVKFCKGLGGQKGYMTALDTLESTYDDPDAVTHAYMSELKDGGRVESPNDFFRLSADLRSAATILAKHDRLYELENQHTIRTIVMRLPRYAILKWRKRALDAKFDSSGTNSYPHFNQFVEFVNVLAREARDSTWGDIDSLMQNVKQTSISCHSATSSDVTFSRTTRVVTCYMCQGNHTLYKCAKFCDMSVNDRTQFVNDNNICFRCLGKKFQNHICRSSYLCRVPGCGRPHSYLLHRENDTRNNGPTSNVPTNRDQTRQEDKGNSEDISQVSTSCINAPCGTQDSTCVLLPLVGVYVNGSRTVEYALLDRGSQRTVIAQSLRDELNIPLQETNTKLEGIWGSNHVSKKVQFEIKSTQNGNKCFIDAVVLPRISARHPPTEVDIAKYPYLADLPLIYGKSSKARILIGQDHAHLLMPYDYRKHEDITLNTLFAEKTYLGWAVQGPLCNDINATNIASCNNVNLSHDFSISTEEQIERLWQIEGADSKDHNLAPNDQEVLKLWDQKSVFKEGHWYVPIPWKHGKPSFENNFGVAKHLLDSLVKRLQRDGIIGMYHEAIQKLLDKGYIEKVPQNELFLKDGTVRYTPHFHDKKKMTKDGKLRIIMDAKHKYKGVSFNSQCLPGPNYVNNLTKTMLRLRQFKYIVKADIEGMYMQIRLFPEDRRSLRFLWYDTDGNLLHFQYRAHIFGGIASGSAAGYILNRISHMEHVSDFIGSVIRDMFYVDDLTGSVKTDSEVRDIVQNASALLKENGFNLKEFVVNDPTIAQELDEDCIAPEMIDFMSSEVQVVDSKTLGVRLDIKSDQFMYINFPGECSGPVTRRIILSGAHKLFDLIGFIIPVTMKGRMYFQDATRLKLKWDDPLPQTLADEWNTWIRSLQGLATVRFNRCLITNEYLNGTSELIHFSDAGRRGYGAVIVNVDM